MKTAFMIGISGMGMAPLALYLRQMGYNVIGYDDNPQSHVHEKLRQEGVEILSASDALEKYQNIDEVIYSTAIGPTHPLYLKAKSLGVKLTRRGEYVAQLLKGKKIIAIVGSHGKTTTTSMLVQILLNAGFEFGYLVGAWFRDSNCLSGFYNSKSEWVLVEVDESDGSINAFSPEITLLLNDDWDHPANYATPDGYSDVLISLLKRTKTHCLIGLEAQNVLQRVSSTSLCFQTVGVGGDYDYTIKPVSASKYSVQLKNGFPCGEVELKLFGVFNVENALKALAVTHLLGVAIDKNPLLGYNGIERRQDVLHKKNGFSFTVLADYAHHPREIRALLSSVREHYNGKVVVVFQPHRYSRTKQLHNAFAKELALADEIILMPVYAASEDYDPDGTSDAIYEDLEGIKAEVTYLQSPKDLFDKLNKLTPFVGVLLFIGAGDINVLAHSFVRTLDILYIDTSQLASETLFKVNEPLASKTTLRVGGHARYYAEPACLEDLQYLIYQAYVQHVPVFLLGRGSNVIVPDDGFEGLVIRLANSYWKKIEVLKDGRFWVRSGVRLRDICTHACKLGWSGFEFLEGIPGSLGGALRMNAGAMGGWMFDVVDEIEFVTLKGQLRRLMKNAFTVEYRKCYELQHAIATGAILRPLGYTSPDEVRKIIKEMADKRHSTQPHQSSAGCIFKNPQGSSAGKLIDELGLKGTYIGNAQVSDVHANFIINKGGATSKDVFELVKSIKSRVSKEKGIDLEPEVLIMGKNWEDIL